MYLNPIIRLSAAGILAFAGLATAASAASVSVSITNEQGPNGVFLTPVLSIFHDGSYDTFDVGGIASPGVEAVAEGGVVTQAVADAQAAGAASGVITSPGGFAGAPVVDPGETATLQFDLDPASDRYFSYLSMVIPSNDLFIGNPDQMAHEIFDIAGDFTDIGTIFIYSTDVWDAGTEENNNLGAAFNAAGGDATDTTKRITQQGSLFFLSGESTAAGTVLDLANGRTLLATINISEVPVPAAFPMLLAGLGGLGLMKRKRRS